VSLHAALPTFPTSTDLAHAAPWRDRAGAPAALYARCVTVDGDVDPAAIAAEVERALAALAPSPETSLALSCPACGHAWSEAFDIGEYLWLELDAAARRIVVSVAQLGRIYGWTEAE